MNRGVVKADLKQYSAAITDFDTAIQLAPDYPLAYKNRAVSKIQLSQFSAAERDYKAALKLAKRSGNQSLQADIEEKLRLLREMD